MGPTSSYVLGSDEPEIARLDGQAEALRSGTALLALAKPITATGLATEAELEVDTLEERIDRALRDADAVLVAPTLVGAWGRASDERPAGRGPLTPTG